MELSGEMTIQCVASILKKIEREKNLFKSDIKINVAQVTEIDTAGIQLLLYMKKKLHSHSKDARFVIEQANDVVSYPLRLLRQDSILVS